MNLPPHGSEVETKTERQEFFREMHSWIDNPPNNEPVIAAFSAAALEASTTNQAYSRLADDYLASEQLTIPSYRVNKYFKAHQAILLNDKTRERTGYPRDFDKVDTWTQFLQATFSSAEQPEYVAMKCLLETMPLQTNRWSRAVVPAVVAAVRSVRSHLEGPPIIHEYGSAAGLVLNAFAMRMYPDTTVVNEQGEPDRQRSATFGILAHTTPLGKGIGIEARPPKSPTDHDWIKSCTLNPSQLDQADNNGRQEEAYDTLSIIKPPHVTLLKDNFLALHPRHAAMLKAAKADIAYAPHVFSQNPNHIDETVEAMLPGMKNTGVILANEYAEVDNGKLQILQRWYSGNWLCKTLALNVNDLEAGWFPIFEWETSSCEKVRIVEEHIEKLGRLAMAFGARA